MKEKKNSNFLLHTHTLSIIYNSIDNFLKIVRSNVVTSLNSDSFTYVY